MNHLKNTPETNFISSLSEGEFEKFKKLADTQLFAKIVGIADSDDIAAFAEECAKLGVPQDLLSAENIHDLALAITNRYCG